MNQFARTDLFCDYYAQWVSVYKEGAIRKVTLDKYLMTQEWLKKLIPEVRLCDMTRIVYQQLLNDYARIHERQTTMDFHHQLNRQRSHQESDYQREGAGLQEDQVPESV